MSRTIDEGFDSAYNLLEALVDREEFSRDEKILLLELAKALISVHTMFLGRRSDEISRALIGLDERNTEFTTKLIALDSEREEEQKPKKSTLH